MKKILLLVACLFAVYTTSYSQEDCTGPLTVTIQGSSSSTPLDASESSVIQPDCGPNGSISIEVTGGSPDYSLQWIKDGEEITMDQTVTNTTDGIDVLVEDLAAGEYAVSITDDSGCSMELGPWTLVEPAGIVITGIETDPNCNVEGTTFNGTIDVSVSGGVAASGYTYAWSTDDGEIAGANDVEDLSDLGAGTYTVVVTDDNGCTAEASYTLTAPDELTLSLASTDLNCHSDNGAADGSITVTTEGGTGEYTYSWTTTDGGGDLVADAGDQTGLTAGTYTLEVKDENGCSISAEVTLEGPTAIAVALTAEDATCNSDNGTSDGSIDITVSGGSGDYTYEWTAENGSTGLDVNASNQTGLNADTYTVVVTDLNGCSTEASITIEGPDAIIVDASTVDPSCGDIQDGSITLASVTGGDGSFTYNWNTINGSGVTTTAQSQSDLGPGTYMLTITDGAGCSATFDWELSAPEAILVSVDNQEDPDCHPSNGPENGTITVSATGGSGTFTYTWTSDNADAVLTDNVATQSNLPGGEYTVVVSDESGCSAEEVINLTPAQDIVVSDQVVPPSCAGNNGSIWLAVSPDEGASYTYVWSTTDGSGINQGEKDQVSLTPGTYTVEITNQNDCSKTLEYVVPNTSGVEIAGDVTSEILCNGDNSGEITITASGGTGDLTYSIDDEASFQESNVFGGLEAGEYTIVVKDSNGCTEDFEITVEEPAQLTAGTCTEAQDLCNANEGEIKVQASGGVAPYTVTWSSPDGGTLAETSGVIDAAGGSFTFTEAQGGKSYSFIVTDANGCMIP